MKYNPGLWHQVQMVCFISLSIFSFISDRLEKEAVRQLITKAIKGLEENGRIEPTAYLDENAKAIQVNMDTFGSLMSNKYYDIKIILVLH